MTLANDSREPAGLRAGLRIEGGRFRATLDGDSLAEGTQVAFYLLHNGRKAEATGYSDRRDAEFRTVPQPGRYKARAFVRSGPAAEPVSVLSDSIGVGDFAPPEAADAPAAAAPPRAAGERGASGSLIERLQAIKPRQDVLSHIYISLRHRYMYAAVGKAANTTVKHHLYELEYSGTRFKTKSLHDRQASPLLSPFQLPDDLLEEVMTSPKYFRFTVVRNPYTRLLSCYLDRIVPRDSLPYRQVIAALGRQPGEEVSFAEFVQVACRQRPFEQNNHWRLQVAEICRDVIAYDDIGKQESFAQDMARMWARIAPGKPRPDFAAENKAPSITSAERRIAEFYTPELVDAVRTAYQADFDAFGYRHDPE